MPSFTLTTDSTTPQTLADGEFGIIQEGVRLDTEDGAIDGTGGNVLNVYGTVSSDDYGLAHRTGFLSVVIGEAARIGGAGYGMYSYDNDGASIENSGRIAGGEGVALYLEGAGDMKVVNDGKITARGIESYGIYTSAEGEDVTIANRGTIAADLVGIDHAAGEMYLTNRGAIEGGDYAYEGWSGYDSIRNFGSFEGGVSLRGGDDFFENRSGGSVDSIDLGGGDDVYYGRGSGSARRVEAGGGRDTLVSSKADDVFEGGGASDVFYFRNKGGDDKIVDFGKSDLVYLSSLEIEGGYRDIRSDVRDTAKGCLIDLSDEFDLTILLVGYEKADLRASDFVFTDLMVA